MSLWNFALEVHTGRFFKFIFGDFYFVTKRFNLTWSPIKNLFESSFASIVNIWQNTIDFNAKNTMQNKRIFLISIIYLSFF